MSEGYDGPQVVGLDLHRNRTVMVRMTPGGDVLESVRFANDAQVLLEQIGKAGDAPAVVVEAAISSALVAALHPLRLQDT